MWGQLISGIEDARAALRNADRARMLLSTKDRIALDRAARVITGIEQRATAAYETERKRSP